jgi:hypothetical protein
VDVQGETRHSLTSRRPDLANDFSFHIRPNGMKSFLFLVDARHGKTIEVNDLLAISVVDASKKKKTFTN